MALNAHTGLPGLKTVLFSPGWAVKLYRKTYNRESNEKHAEIVDFFAFVLGHEISHKEQRMKPLLLFGKRRKYADWIREINADFGGLKKTGLSPQRVAYCLHREIPDKRRQHGSVRKTWSFRSSHPTWEYRVKCWKMGSFNEDVIDMICRDCNVYNLHFRNKMKKYYL